MSWKNGLVSWVEGKTAFVSVVFSWLLPQAYSLCVWYAQQGYRVRAGGPAVRINPLYLLNVAFVGGPVEALIHHNPDATYTTNGCIRKCSFCIVPKIEQFYELPDEKWTPKKMICDNNLLAASKGHFDHVIDRLKEANITGIDFNGGLDARLLTEHHAQRLAELPGAILHMAWDNIETEKAFRSAYGKLRSAGIAANRIRVFCLIGYEDTPEDALYRLEEVKKLGSMPNPMRFQPIDTAKKNSYVSPNWTELELKRYMRYWARQSYFRGISFNDYLPQRSKKSFEGERLI